MNVRIDSIIISVDLIFLVAACVCFARLSYVNLKVATCLSKKRTLFVLTVVSMTGVFGSWVYGLLGPGNALEQGMPISQFSFAFGSFGGYWGVILGSAFVSRMTGTSTLEQADAFVPGILAGGAIARTSGFFNNANPGVSLQLDALPWFQPFKIWALYDIAAHAVILLLILCLFRWCKSFPGLILAVFMIGYGLLRFVIEFVRETHYAVCELFTHGHILAAVQTAAGLALVIGLVTKRHAFPWRLDQPDST